MLHKDKYLLPIKEKRTVSFSMRQIKNERTISKPFNEFSFPNLFKSSLIKALISFFLQSSTISPEIFS